MEVLEQKLEREPASFRDPSGFIFIKNKKPYRQINKGFEEDYNMLLHTGLFKMLVEKKWLVDHQPVNLVERTLDPEAFIQLAPETIPFISYPYEWSFSQLRDAALLTLEIQKLAMQHGMTLKDASAYNIQFLNGQPILIDILSFEKLKPGKPWIAYRQFCQHFLAPLALMSKTNIELSHLLRCYIDGIPLNVAASLLPWSSRWGLGIGLHLHLHAKTQVRCANQSIESKNNKTKSYSLSENGLKGIINSLYKTVEKLNWSPGNTEWHSYYIKNNNYMTTSMSAKELIVLDIVKKENPKVVWDLGANNGRFSRIAASVGANVIAYDIDPSCVEMNYRMVKSNAEKKILPLLLDLTNPSPDLGWANQERKSLYSRGPADLILALGLIHHLAISNNVPFDMIAEYFAKIGDSLLIEFVPKEDSQVQKLLSYREDTFDLYYSEIFISEFTKFFTIIDVFPVKDSVRVMYWMKKRHN